MQRKHYLSYVLISIVCVYVISHKMYVHSRHVGQGFIAVNLAYHKLV